MCTVTVLRDSSGILVTMNRDEQRSRAPELPPRLCGKAGSGRWVSPLDGESGGTWIGANGRGVVACLLNNYAATPPPAIHGSRGRIIPEALARGRIEEISAWLAEDFDPRGFAPFTLLLASVDNARRFEWEGAGQLLSHPIDADRWMVTSSSWNTEAVLEWRRAEFTRWLDGGCEFDGELPAFHLLQPEGMAEWSPLMAREKTHTRSITQVRLTKAPPQAEMRYWPNPESVAQAPASVVQLNSCR